MFLNKNNEIINELKYTSIDGAFKILYHTSVILVILRKLGYK